MTEAFRRCPEFERAAGARVEQALPFLEPGNSRSRAKLLPFRLVADDGKGTVQIYNRVTPGQVAVGPFAVRVFHTPGNDLPARAGFDHFPFRPVHPGFPLG